MNQVPEKLYHGQWPYNKKKSIQCNLIAQIEPVHDKREYRSGWMLVNINVYRLSGYPV
jgi:hypothetical protein